MAVRLGSNPRLCQKHLFGYGECGVGGKITGTAGAAKSAAAGSVCAVPVWAGHAAAQTQPVDFFTESIQTVVVQGIISFTVRIHISEYGTLQPR